MDAWAGGNRYESVCFLCNIRDAFSEAFFDNWVARVEGIEDPKFQRSKFEKLDRASNYRLPYKRRLKPLKNTTIDHNLASSLLPTSDPTRIMR